MLTVKAFYSYHRPRTFHVVSERRLDGFVVSAHSQNSSVATRNMWTYTKRSVRVFDNVTPKHPHDLHNLCLHLPRSAAAGTRETLSKQG
jgi:hypothetical protein